MSCRELAISWESPADTVQGAWAIGATKLRASPIQRKATCRLHEGQAA